jgi:hypothetical protein
VLDLDVTSFFFAICVWPHAWTLTRHDVSQSAGGHAHACMCVYMPLTRAACTANTLTHHNVSQSARRSDSDDDTAGAAVEAESDDDEEGEQLQQVLFMGCWSCSLHCHLPKSHRYSNHLTHLPLFTGHVFDFFVRPEGSEREHLGWCLTEAAESGSSQRKPRKQRSNARVDARSGARCAR